MKKYPLLTITDTPSAIILANGDYPVHLLPLALLAENDYVVCCDGATDEFVRSGRIPVAIVGDGDSLSELNKKQFASILHSVPDQDTNDLTKAFNYCLQQGKKNILILGATGKREDHTLGNISLLIDYIDEANVEMVTDYGVFTPIAEDCEFESYPGQQVSIFNLSGAVISQERLQYTLPPLNNWWQGTLNASLDHHFIIHTTGKAVIFRAY
ncbi:thiamine diphosphokinase [uncultured Bacteroides sp.]|uniref:thiamine diphosphokinase n=1 Tax=uncultured Bacteroides sp. TaxID=162156 RepID=UPI002AABCE5B|nr:thiamine diphosphokinase [uncultured Bacteroides sp.]